MVRWVWRLFRREWRRQALVLGLLMVAVAATVVGLGVVSNVAELKADPTFGTANTIISLNGSDPTLTSDVAAAQHQFTTVDVVAHQNIPIPGSVSTLDIRAQDPHGPYGGVTLRLDSGRYPAGSGEVALTRGTAQTFDLHVGSLWKEGARTLRVVGLVENPLDLLDQFALVAPGQANPPANVALLVNASQQSLQSFRFPSGAGLSIYSRGAGGRTAAAAAVLVLGTLGLLFVGLMAVAGFAVMAQRRLRALGMLGSLGATDRHIRLVMVANGAAVGATAAIVGTVVGLGAWFAFAPSLQSITQHRVDPFNVPWWAVAAAAALSFVTAVAAAWWPARTVVRIPILAALSGRPPRPRPGHRFAVLGGVLLSAGLVMLAFADGNRAGFIIGGTAATAVGLLFLAPLAIGALAALSRRSTVSVRLAVRDLARYQARSGAALGAVTLAIGISATIAVSASAAQTPSGPGNLAANQLVLYLAPGGAGNQVPPLTPAQQQSVAGRVDQLAAILHAGAVLALEQAYDPRGGLQPAQPGPGGGQPAGYATSMLANVSDTSQGQSISVLRTLYVATPALLTHYGISPNQVQPSSDVLSAQSNAHGVQIFDPAPGSGPPAPSTAPGAGRSKDTSGLAKPAFQTIRQLPSYTSAPGTLITSHAMQTLGLVPIPSGWFLQTNAPLTSSQLTAARQVAATSGLYVETRAAQKSLAPLRNWSTAAGILLALGVLGMTVGLIRSETANDLRTLTATGASSSTRRSLTAVTAGGLALLGAALGTAGGYAALLAWHRSDLSPLGRVPVANVIIILAGLPILAMVSGWLLAGREPPAMARQPLE
jgi:putative ABC transport system permease protein